MSLILDESDDRIAQALAGALAREAAGVQSWTGFEDLLEAVNDDAGSRTRGRRLQWAAAAVVTLVGIGVASPFLMPRLFGGATEQIQSAPPSLAVPATPTRTRPTPAPVSGATSSAPVHRGVPIYYLDAAGLLQREMRDLPGAGRDRLAAAVDALINQPPADPDHTSAWRPGQVRSISRAGTLITVDLSASAFAGFTDTTSAGNAIRQLVYTVTAVVGDPAAQLRVLPTRDGSAELPLVGTSTAGFARQGNWFSAPLWINVPTDSSTLDAGRLEFSGELQGQSGVLRYAITDSAGSTRSGTATLAAPRIGWQHWTITVDLRPGAYTLRLTSGTGAVQDSSFTVR